MMILVFDGSSQVYTRSSPEVSVTSEEVGKLVKFLKNFFDDLFFLIVSLSSFPGKDKRKPVKVLLV